MTGTDIKKDMLCKKSKTTLKLIVSADFNNLHNIILTSNTDLKLFCSVSMSASDCLINIIFTFDIIWLDVLDVLDLYH